MQANPEQFQAIAIGQRSAKELDRFTLNNVNIPCENEVKLLGVTIDFELNFNSHISNICKKASKQLNCLRHGPFDIRGGGGGLGFFSKKISLL